MWYILFQYIGQEYIAAAKQQDIFVTDRGLENVYEVNSILMSDNDLKLPTLSGEIRDEELSQCFNERIEDKLILLEGEIKSAWVSLFL